MKKLFITLALFAISLPAFCQNTENDAVKKVINKMFDSMRSADTVDLRATFAEGMVLQSVHERKDRPDSLAVTSADEFVKIIGAPHKDMYDERITFGDVSIYNNVATVWAPYKFYIGKKFSYCGMDIFQLMKTNIGWRIVSVYYNVQAKNCPE